MRIRPQFFSPVRSTSLLLVMLFALAFNPVVVGQSDSAFPVIEIEALFDEFVPLHLESDHVAGAVVSVVQSGELVFAKGYGFANVEQQTPMYAERTLVHIGSSGKTFTEIAALQLVEQGRLELDADVNTYLDFAIPATYPQPITIRHLLTHTSGFEGRDLHILTENPDTLVPVRDYLTQNIPAHFHTLMALLPQQDLGVFVSFNSAEAIRLVPQGVVLNAFLDRFFPVTLFGAPRPVIEIERDVFSREVLTAVMSLRV